MQSFCFQLRLYQASETEKLCDKLCVWMGDLEGKGSLLGGVIHARCFSVWSVQHQHPAWHQGMRCCSSPVEDVQCRGVGCLWPGKMIRYFPPNFTIRAKFQLGYYQNSSCGIHWTWYFCVIIIDILDIMSVVPAALLYLEMLCMLWHLMACKFDAFFSWC